MSNPYNFGAGDLDQRITLQQKTSTQNSAGEAVESWSDVVTLWAKVLQLTGRDQIAAQQVQYPADVRIIIRNRPGITAEGCRIVWRGQPHEIVGTPAQVGNRREWLEIMATGGIRSGR